ncbi:MAG: hypothetical protein RMK01_12495 [Thermomicrobium sp.]|nr:hypothetical protein [Thermomicrobium sp.]
MRRHDPLVEALTPVIESAEKLPTPDGVQTGVPGLDELFVVTEWHEGTPVRRSLGGFRVPLSSG